MDGLNTLFMPKPPTVTLETVVGGTVVASASMPLDEAVTLRSVQLAQVQFAEAMIQLSEAKDHKAAIVFYYLDVKSTRTMMTDLKKQGYVGDWFFEGNRVVFFPGARKLTREELTI